MPGIATNSGDWGDLAPPSWGGAEGFNAIPLTGWEESTQDNSGVKTERKVAPVKKVDPPTPEEIQKAEQEIARIEKIIIAGRQKSAKHRERLSALDVIRKECREQIEPLRSDMDEIKAEKTQIIAKKDEIAPRNKEGGLPNKKQARDAIPFTSSAELSRAIAAQDFDLSHTNFASIRDEKEAIAALRTLKSYIPAVAAYEKEFGVKPEVEQAMKITRDQLKPLNARFDELKSIADGKFKKLNEFRDKITEVNEEADGIRKVMQDENAALDKEFEKVKAFRGKHGGMVADFFKRIADINSGKVALSEAHRVAMRQKEEKEEARNAVLAKKKAAADAIIAAQAAAKEAANAQNAAAAAAAAAPAATGAVAAAQPSKKAKKAAAAEEAEFSLQAAGKPVVAPTTKTLTAEERRQESLSAHQKHQERAEKAEAAKAAKAQKAQRAALRREEENKQKREREAKELAQKEKAEALRRQRKAEAKQVKDSAHDSIATRGMPRKKKANSMLPKFVAENQTAFIACACLAAFSVALMVLVKL